MISSVKLKDCCPGILFSIKIWKGKLLMRIRIRIYFCLAVQQIGFKLKTQHSNKLRSNGSILSAGEMAIEGKICVLNLLE